MPFRNIAVGVWSYDTHTNTHVPWATRLPLLTQAVQALAAWRDQTANAARLGADEKQRQLWSNPTGRLSMVFVAPEYMFMGTCATGLSNPTDDRFLSDNEHLQILNALTTISDGYGVQLCFIPGSIAFKVPFLQANDCAADIGARYAKVESGIQWGAAQIQQMAARQGVAFTPAQARAWPLSGTMGGMAARTTDDKLNLLAKSANNRFANLYLGQNKMYMLHRGKVVGTYRKKCDFHEVLPGDVRHTIFIPGDTPGRSTVAVIPFGMEICLDHGSGVLSDTPSLTGSLPSVHALASACVPIDPGNVVVRDKGYVLHASSALKFSGAWRKTTPGPTNVIGANWQPVGNGMLGTGVIELDIA